MTDSSSSTDSATSTATTDPVRAYLNDVGRHDLLTRLDEERLGRAIETGRSASKELEEGDGDLPPERQRQLRAMIADCERSTRTFIVSNLRLVISIAKRYRSSGIPMQDLIQEGNIGLIQAVRKFDYRRGFKFSTYATHWIRQAIGRAVAGSGRTIRLPVEVGERLALVRRAQSKLESTLGRPPTLQELGADVGLPPSKVADLLDHGADLVSLNTPLGDDGGELGDMLEDLRAGKPFDEAVAGMTPSAVDRLLALVDDRERQVLCLRFGLSGESPLRFGLSSESPMSLAEVGARMGVTGERIRQIERRALARLKPQLACLEEQGLLDP